MFLNIYIFLKLVPQPFLTITKPRHHFSLIHQCSCVPFSARNGLFLTLKKKLRHFRVSSSRNKAAAAMSPKNQEDKHLVYV